MSHTLETTAVEYGRRFGAALAFLINAVLLFVVQRWDHWSVLGFLDESFDEVVPAISASLIASMAVQAWRIIGTGRAGWALGDAASTAVGVWASIRVWQVFPFRFDDGGFPWNTLVRGLLIVAIVGGVIGTFAALVRLAVSESE